MFVALAWAMVLVVLPALSQEASGRLTFGVFIFILLLVMVRNAIFDLFGVQGDRIVGKETLPVLIGVNKTMLVLKVSLFCLLLMAIIMPFAGLMTVPYSYLLIPALFYLALFLVFYEKGYYTPGVRLEFGLESAFVFMAVSVWMGA